MSTAPVAPAHADAHPGDDERPTFVLEETGFNEVPPRLRRYFRHWHGPDDPLGPNEVLCPVCHVVLRSPHALRVGDELHCMPCLSTLQVVASDHGLVAVLKLS